ncbi:hypothetical protein RFI_27058 [Reticulomyxa filosa]|uniref:Uncharacterized protein n=1 Tax=Reticulomyxa filosa TaxID=46433 RepID=X6M8T3_RETFI|nr:hypothetical protein RFI_27058 [Reticulomyxa filosa]|eukprot:ETO10319.1 hypothetical protein RFI_27058 [Reticulomyxa filosa]
MWTDKDALNEISVSHGIPSFHGTHSNNAEKVIENLYNERQALVKQMNNINQELLKLSRQQEAKVPEDGDANSDANSVNPAGAPVLQKKVRELEDIIRTDRQTINNLKAEIDTQKTMLDAKITECDQQRSILQTQQAKINTLMAGKDKVDRDINEYEEEIQKLNTMLEIQNDELDNIDKVKLVVFSIAIFSSSFFDKRKKKEIKCWYKQCFKTNNPFEKTTWFFSLVEHDFFMYQLLLCVLGTLPVSRLDGHVFRFLKLLLSLLNANWF